MPIRYSVAFIAVCALPFFVSQAQDQQKLPLRQSMLDAASASSQPLTLRDASRNNRWLGVGVRDIRWALDNGVAYYRWHRQPESDELPAEDPWFRTNGEWNEEVPREEVAQIPAGQVLWNPAGTMATWAKGHALLLYTEDDGTKQITSLTSPIRTPRFVNNHTIDFESDQALYRYGILEGTLDLIAAKHVAPNPSSTEAAEWLADEQRELLSHVRNQDDTAMRSARANHPSNAAQALPVSSSEYIDQIQLSPDNRFVTFRARTHASNRPPTQYIDFVDGSGYAAVHDARAKVGEPRDRFRLGIVPYDPNVLPDSVSVTWVELEEAGDQHTVSHGPFWNLEGTRAVAQFVGENHEDVWYAEIDPATGKATVITHDHDEAWIGGPPVQANYLQPAFMEWLPGDRFVFASERSGWSHLYLANADNTIKPLTSGEWEVRDASLSKDRSTLLLQASKEHPAEDHLYTMPATGGEMVRLTEKPGRHIGYLSPDGKKLAVSFGDNVSMHDLYLGEVKPGSEFTRITVSGTDNYYKHPLVRPEIVSFPHPDGKPIWAALYKPTEQNPEKATLMHIHGGGYRQFAHRGWSVYGYANHLAFIHYALGQGYTVLDFDYRGSAGFGRDYRTDISESMGISDVDGAAAAAQYLVDEHGVDATRIGIYGVSYGGFMTLMAQFRYPGVFAAGIARAPVTDWAHYSDGWTSRILGIPHENPEAYRISSPIYYAEGLEDALMITHGLVDDNVHFQDTARLMQRLIELEKDFEAMVYPVEPHTIQTEASRYDYVRRAAKFFEQHLLRR